MPNDSSLTDPSVFGSYLLSQVGHHAAALFAKLLEPDGLTPVDAGILRIVARWPGISQQELANTLKVYASKLVHLLDSLEKRDLVRREDSSTDRRVKCLIIGKRGEYALVAIRQRTLQLEVELFSHLTPDELSGMVRSLGKVADSNGLLRGVHPAYQNLGKTNE
jgi:DNA-binding MarR family transcriptional regulator